MHYGSYMIRQEIVVTKDRGFTLVEAIIYVGLFAIMFTGIFVSIYPFLTGAERLTRNIATEGEVAFALSKIHYALAQGITTPSDTIATPAPGDTSDVLIIKNGSDETFRLEQNPANSACTPPRICPTLDYSTDGGTPFPLNGERVAIEDFTVTHYGPQGGAPRFLEINFTANGRTVGPIIYYLHF